MHVDQLLLVEANQFLQNAQIRQPLHFVSHNQVFQRLGLALVKVPFSSVVARDFLQERLVRNLEFVVWVITQLPVIDFHEFGHQRLSVCEDGDTFDDLAQLALVLPLVGKREISPAKSFVMQSLIFWVANDSQNCIDVLLIDLKWAHDFVEDLDHVLLRHNFLHLLILVAE